jgi:hypothetical protein
VLEYRAVLRADSACAAAWFGLANIKTRQFDARELAQMERLRDHPAHDQHARAALEFALAKGYEDHARFADAFAILGSANSRMRRIRPGWDAGTFSAHTEEVLDAFAGPVEQSSDAGLGSEVIFVVSMPRAGSTLTEQILAAHSQVEGAGELDELMQVVREESMRRRLPFPHWVAASTAHDWERMGRRYLTLTQRWQTRARFTDKQPNNWLLVGAIRAMLPGARVVNCRRDPLETCWSCYQQMFMDAPAFSYALDDIAAFWNAYDRAASFWQTRRPCATREQHYEALLADPAGQTAELLAFCGLQFEAQCLDFHRQRRAVRTASAAQVREPLRAPSAHAARYGSLLDPLRGALRLRPRS